MYAARAKLVDPFHWWVQIHAPKYLDGYEHVFERYGHHVCAPFVDNGVRVREQMIAEGCNMAKYQSYISRQDEEIVMHEKAMEYSRTGTFEPFPTSHVQQSAEEDIVKETDNEGHEGHDGGSEGELSSLDSETSSNASEENPSSSYSITDSEAASSQEAPEEKKKPMLYHNEYVDSSSDITVTNSSDLDSEMRRFMNDVISVPELSDEGAETEEMKDVDPDQRDDMWPDELDEDIKLFKQRIEDETRALEQQSTLPPQEEDTGDSSQTPVEEATCPPAAAPPEVSEETDIHGSPCPAGVTGVTGRLGSAWARSDGGSGIR
eukprot:42030-Hanusia_phi.AAC.5